MIIFRATLALLLLGASHSVLAEYKGYLYQSAFLTAENMTSNLCARYAAEHISALGFKVTREDGFEVDAWRGKERVQYSCAFGTTYGGRGVLSIVYIPEGEQGYSVVEASDNWKKIQSPQMVLYGMLLN